MLRASAIVTAALHRRRRPGNAGRGRRTRRQLADVPGMAHGVELSTGCTSWERYIFGRGDTGQTYACHYIPNQWPPVADGLLGVVTAAVRGSADRCALRRPGPRGRTVPGRTCVGVHRIPGLAAGLLRLSHLQRHSEEQRHDRRSTRCDRDRPNGPAAIVRGRRLSAHRGARHHEPCAPRARSGSRQEPPRRSTTTRIDGRPLSQSPRRPTERASPGRSDDSSGATSLSRGGSSR